MICPILDPVIRLHNITPTEPRTHVGGYHKRGWPVVRYRMGTIGIVHCIADMLMWFGSEIPELNKIEFL